MKKLSILLLAASMTFPALAQEAESTAPEVSVELTFDFVSAYFFREANFSAAATQDDAGKDKVFPVAPAFQSGIGASTDTVGITLWQSFSLDKKAPGATETDILFDLYAGPMTFSYGLFYYANEATGNGTYNSATVEVQVNYATSFGLDWTLGADGGGSYIYYMVGYDIAGAVGLPIDLYLGYIGNQARGTDAAQSFYGDSLDSSVKLDVGYSMDIGPGSLGVYGSVIVGLADGDKTAGKELQSFAGFGYALPL